MITLRALIEQSEDSRHISVISPMTNDYYCHDFVANLREDSSFRELHDNLILKQIDEDVFLAVVSLNDIYRVAHA